MDGRLLWKLKIFCIIFAITWALIWLNAWYSLKKLRDKPSETKPDLSRFPEACLVAFILGLIGIIATH